MAYAKRIRRHRRLERGHLKNRREIRKQGWIMGKGEDRKSKGLVRPEDGPPRVRKEKH